MAVKDTSKAKRSDADFDDFGVWMAEYLGKRDPKIKKLNEEREARLAKFGTNKKPAAKKSTAKKK